MAKPTTLRADRVVVITDDPCKVCATPLASVVINAGDRIVTMRSCSRCDRRWWTADGEDTDPTVVFAKRSA